MKAVRSSGHSMDLTAGRNGVPASYRGVPTSVVISKAGLSQNSQAAWTVQIGLRVTDNGKTEAMSRRQAILSFLIGKATEKPTM